VEAAAEGQGGEEEEEPVGCCWKDGMARGFVLTVVSAEVEGRATHLTYLRRREATHLTHLIGALSSINQLM
jgi:hypothetical protein